MARPMGPGIARGDLRRHCRDRPARRGRWHRPSADCLDGSAPAAAACSAAARRRADPWPDPGQSPPARRFRICAASRGIGRLAARSIARSSALGAGRLSRFDRLVAAQHIDQREEGGIALRLLAQQIEAEGGLIVLARAKLAEDLGLLPIGFAAGDLACIVDRLAGAVIIAGEQQRIHALAGGHRIGAAARHQASNAAASRDSPMAISRSARAPNRLTPPPLPSGASALVSNSRRVRSRMAGEAAAGESLGSSARPERGRCPSTCPTGKPPAPSCSGAAIVGRHIAEVADLDALPCGGGRRSPPGTVEAGKTVATADA